MQSWGFLNKKQQYRGSDIKMFSTKYAIVGSGPAAFYAAQAIRKRDPGGKLVMIGAEGYLPYFRPLTSYRIADLVPKEKIFLREAEYYHRHKIEFIGGKVTEVKGEEKILAYTPLSNNGEEKSASDTQNARYTNRLHFEKLLIASGAAPSKPDIPGIDTPGVYYLRTIIDAEKIAARAKGRRKALLLGGGLVSLKTAYSLHKLGLEPTLVIASNQILSQMLDNEGAEMVARHLAEKGLGMVYQKDITEIHGNGSGVTGVTLADGRKLKTDLIVVGKGVKPCTSFLKESGIEGENGIPVNEQLQTNLPDVYAAGDVVLSKDLLLEKPANNALWPNATAQGEIAGANMSGEQLIYRGSMKMNAAEFFGLPVIAAGLGRVQEGGADHLYEIFRAGNSTGSGKKIRYLKLVFQEDLLVGYISIGENRKAGVLTNLIMSRRPLSQRHKEQLAEGNLSLPF